MQIESLDHLVLTVRNLDAAIAFYSSVLGMRVVTFGANRKALAFGSQKINLHLAGQEFEPKTDAKPGPIGAMRPSNTCEKCGKLFAATFDVCPHCKSNKIGKGCLIIAIAVIGLGGGVITDLAGYVAGCYMRGIDVIHIPTSLLGMVDAAIGGKSAVNLPQGKNLVGLFYHPKVVLINQSYLRTLPQREFCAGLAEIIK